jgi:uncharacterized protein YbcI
MGAAGLAGLRLDSSEATKGAAMATVDEEPESLTGGELNAAVTREVVRIHTASLGRGPRKSFSFYNGNVIVCVLHEGLSRAERTLVDSGDGEAVRQVRKSLQGAMAGELRESVEELTGREVLALLSDSHVEPDVAIEVFVLDYPIG